MIHRAQRIHCSRICDAFSAMCDEIHKTDTQTMICSFGKLVWYSQQKSYVLNAVVDGRKQENKTQLWLCFVYIHLVTPLTYAYEWNGIEKNKFDIRNSIMS